MATKNNDFYLGNSSLPTPKATFDYGAHPEWVVDIEKCKKNILYFAENFFYIINLDEGRIPIKLRPYQRRLLRSLRDNRFVVTVAGRQCGKALDCNTPILTVSGWSTMGQLKTGDKIYGLDGKECIITQAHEIRNNRPCYQVEFNNGEVIVADEDHLWFTQNKNEGNHKQAGSNKTTKQIFETLFIGYQNESNHRIPACVGGISNIAQSKLEAQWHYIKNITPVESRPVRCITVDREDGMFLAGKQLIPTHNSTTLTIFVLWMACFADDQRILIIANKEDIAIEIFSRVKLAYEMLPNYLKPGTVEYGKTSMKMGNGSQIGISTTSSDSARGKSANLIVLDELAHVPEEIADEFFQSVYPVVTSSKKAKIFAISTPKGTNNLFFKLYDGALKKDNGWFAERVDWWEIPGRDEVWKEQTIKAMGSRDMWEQEFNNVFHKSGESAIGDELVEKLQKQCTAPIHILEDGDYLIWDMPDPNKLYVVGVDVSEGVGAASTAVQILDVTDLKRIEQVACYTSNKITPIKFIPKLYEILQHWGKPPVLIERNNCGAQVVDQLKDIYRYEHIVSYGTNNFNRIGVQAHTNTKYKGVVNQRYWLNETGQLNLKDINTVNELSTFQRQSNGTWCAKTGSQDDRVMSLIWALIILEVEICEKYFEIISRDKNNKPAIIRLQDYNTPRAFYDINSALKSAREDDSDMLPIFVRPDITTIDNADLMELDSMGWKMM